MALGIQPVDLMNEASFALLIQTPCRPGQSKPKFDAYKLNHKYLGIQSHHTVTPYNVRSTLQHRQQVFVYRLLRVRVGELGRMPIATSKSGHSNVFLHVKVRLDIELTRDVGAITWPTKAEPTIHLSTMRAPARSYTSSICSQQSATEQHKR